MILDRRTLLSSLAAASATGLPGQVMARTPDGVVQSALDRVFAEAAPVGLGATLVLGGAVAASGVRGLRQREGGDAIQIGDRWHLGSNTKAMTAVLFARLVEQGRADWGLKIVDVIPGTHDPAWTDTRVIDFMHHRAGLTDANVMGQSWLAVARADPASLPEQRLALAQKALSVPPDGTPGRFQYGNANYVLVGAVIEAITGLGWEQALQEQVFAPLELTSAGFGPPPEPAPWAHRVIGGQALSLPPGHPGADNPQALGPAGTVHMAMSDYARFLTLFSGQGGGFLSPDSITRLTEPVTTPPPRYACGWIVLQQAWARGTPESTGRVLTHDGSNTAWYASAVVAPEIDLALITVSNDGTAGARACPMLVEAVIGGLMAEKAAGG